MAAAASTRTDDTRAGVAIASAAIGGNDEALAAAARLLLDRRTECVRPFLVEQAGRIARLCHRMAERFARGGRLIAFGQSAAAQSDVRHIAVEFVHPVIVGKRALPAIGLGVSGGAFARQIALLARPEDIIVAFPGELPDQSLEPVCNDTVAAMAAARRIGCLTMSFTQAAAEWEFVHSGDAPFLTQEIDETLYHVLWELVHVFFEHKGLLDGGGGVRHNAGASSFLYPFLGHEEQNLEQVITDVRNSIIAKTDEITTLRQEMFAASSSALCAAARTLRSAFENGGTLLVLGNGGSATDAMDAAADYRFPSLGLQPRPVLDLTEDAAILTAIANDIGADAIFVRQIIAYARPGDVVMAFSTSGNSRNVTEALSEAKRRKLATIAFVGYDGGEIAARQLADHLISVPSQYIPRIQEAQATAHHIIRELVERA